MSSENSMEELLATYFSLMSINGASRVYRTAMESGIVDSILDGPKTLEDIASACGTVPTVTAFVLEVLESIGVVSQEEASYALTPVASMLLRSDYRTLGDEYWDHLAPFLKDGVPLKRMDDAAESEGHYVTQAAALRWMLGPAAEAAANALEIGKTRKNLQILDVGAGSAIWSLHFASKDPESQVTVIDWPSVCDLASQTAVDLGIADRLSRIEGNYHEVPVPSQTYDMVIIANVAHLETEEGNFSLFEKLFKSLKPGGEIAIIDIFPGDQRGDLQRTLYTLGLALRTEQGSVHSEEALDRLLDNAGFEKANLLSLPVTPHTMGVLMARRPA